MAEIRQDSFLSNNSNNRQGPTLARPNPANNKPQQQKPLVIDKQQLESFLKRHPEVVNAMAQEMQQAAGAVHSIPRVVPANQQTQTISQQPASKPINIGSPVSQSAKAVNSKSLGLQAGIQQLVTIPNKTPPSSPFGIGEMNQASRVDITSLDTHAELYQTDFKVRPVSGQIQSYQQASGAYSHQASIEPIRLEKDTVRKNNRDTQRRLKSANNLKSALATALTAAQVVEGKPVTISPKSITKTGLVQSLAKSSKSALPNQKVSQESTTATDRNSQENNSQNARETDILPYAERYARQLGYSPEKGETAKILKDTVKFYSKSDKLANTLKNLVNSLPQ